MSRFSAVRKAHIRLGIRGEELTASFLRRNGSVILARNWRTRAGELDIVSWDGEALHFTEVKSLRSKPGYTPAGNLSPVQRRRNFHAAKIYLKILGQPDTAAHFDLCEVIFTASGRFLEFRYHPDYLPPVLPAVSADEKRESEPEPEVLPESRWKRWWIGLNLFPCPVCGTGNGMGKGLICNDCRRELDLLQSGKRCPGCGGELDGILALCSECIRSGTMPLWQGNLSLFTHRGKGRKIIIDFKYGGRTEYARALGCMAAEAVERSGFTPDIVTAVPMHWFRKLLRGYNQAELFGMMTAKQLGIPYKTLLIRKKWNRRQATLGRAGRLKNLKNTFYAVSPDEAAGKRILLVDDVFTTGATVTAAVKALMKSSPAAVHVLTASRAVAVCSSGKSRKTYRRRTADREL